jgi:hypothetical protein
MSSSDSPDLADAPNPASSAAKSICFTRWPITAPGGDHARQVRFGMYACFCMLLLLPVSSTSLYSRFGGAGVLTCSGLLLAAMMARWLMDRPTRADMLKARATIRSRDTSSLISCHGEDGAIARVLSRGELEDVLFEPRIFFGLGAFEAGGHQRAAQWIFGCAIAAILIGVHVQAGTFRGNVFVEIMGAFAGGIALGTFAFPTYIRIVPGRIDVLQCGFLGRVILNRRSIDLRGRKLVVDLSTKVITIGQNKEVPPIGYAAMWDGPAFVNAVLAAAISTHTPAPLPDDALTG